MKILTVFFLVLLSTLFQRIFAQRNIAPIIGINISYKPLQDTTGLFGANLQVSLLDTSNISDIVVRMDTVRNGLGIFNKSFTYTEIGNFSDGTSMTKTGKKIMLGLGS